MFNLVIGIVLILLVLWYAGYIGGGISEIGWFDRVSGLVGSTGEDYRSCRDCDGYSMPRNGVVVLNPFIWPYSGTSCVDDLYSLNKNNGIDLGFNAPAPNHLNTPDHVAFS